MCQQRYTIFNSAACAQMACISIQVSPSWPWINYCIPNDRIWLTWIPPDSCSVCLPEFGSIDSNRFYKYNEPTFPMGAAHEYIGSISVRIRAFTFRLFFSLFNRSQIDLTPYCERYLWGWADSQKGGAEWTLSLIKNEVETDSVELSNCVQKLTSF